MLAPHHRRAPLRLRRDRSGLALVTCAPRWWGWARCALGAALVVAAFLIGRLTT